jgi:outer membrane protein insertion porin family
MVGKMWSTVSGRGLLLLVLLLMPLVAQAEAFEIEDIKVEGLQRISAGTVFNYLPVRVGDELDSQQSANIIRTLYKTGFFKDVRLEREGDVLIISVVERPAVASIDIEGNKNIETEELLQALKDIGLAPGRVFNRFVLDKIEQELRRQYFAQGKYGVKLKTTVTPLERNRVAINIDITEGETAKIKQINIVGNHSFEEDELTGQFELGSSNWLSFLSKNDQYSKQRLSGDLERLRSFYLNRGYINFRIASTQVSITPDKQDIYITINIEEGDVYTVSDVKLAGDLVLEPDKIFPMVQVRRNNPFSRKEATDTSEDISKLLGNNGYAFANVNSIPEIDEEKKQVAITFFIDPGKRVYVRRINMAGNTRTRDVVLRREMRQMESAWFSSEKVKRSRERLQRLGFFEDVTIETPAVPGTTDQVDVDVSITEKASGNLLAGLGFSQSQGLILNTSITQDNFLGTGKRVDAAFNNSSANSIYQFAYTNPYYTINGVSRGFILRYRKTNADEEDIAKYKTNVGTAGVNFGVPINEYDRVNFSLNVEHTDLQVNENEASQEVLEFEDDEGDNFLNFELGTSWSHDSRNRAVFPSRGGLQRLSASVTVPGSDLQFYKLSYSNRRYFELISDLTLGLKGDLGYGNGYGGTDDLPFFDNFFAGGPRTVRGFKDNTLGPRDSNNDPLGGRFKMVGGVELLHPIPIEQFKDAARFSLFLDAGNVFGDGYEFDATEIRYSSGIGATWLSPFGALTVSLAYPLNDKDNDDVEVFQFSFGSTF